jgi:ketosteroid isomerase-like protein
LNDLVETTGFDVEDNIEAPDQVISYGYYTSRNRQTGNVARARFVFRWEFQNGKVVRYEAVLDSAPIVSAERTEKSSEQANLGLVLDIYDAFRRGDVGAVLNSLDPQADLDFEGPKTIPWAGSWHGREGWASFFQTLGENVDEINVQMEPFAVQGDKVVTAGRWQARVKLTGKRIDSPLLHLWTLRDGLVKRCQEMTNSAAEASACMPELP